MKLNTFAPALALAWAYSMSVPGAEHGDTKCRLDVGNAPLDSALQEIARQCNVQILFFSDITARKAAPKLTGEYAIDEALRLLLKDAGLAFRRVDTATIEITTAVVTRAQTRETRVPRESRPEPELQEVVIQGTSKDLVATRTETPLREIPQTISIIAAEQMRQQGNLNFMDAIQDAVGISIKRQDTYFREVYTRGHEISSYSLDGGGGIRASVQGVSMMDVLLVPDIGEFDRIEVLRGSNALFGADAAPGGTINLIRKRPLQHAQILFSATAGSWNNFRQEVDATGALALNGALRGRMVVSNASRKFFYKGPKDRRQSIFGVLDYDLTDNTVAALGGSYTKSHGSPFDVTATLSRGFGTLGALSDLKLPRETAFAFDWSYFDTRVAEGFLRLEHAFGRESRLRLNATFLDSRAAYRVGSVPLFVGNSVPTVMQHYTLEPFEESHLSLEGTFTGADEWRGHRVEWALGADLLQTASRTRTGWYAFVPAVDIDPYNFDPAMLPAPAIPAVPEILPDHVQNPRIMNDDMDIRIGGVFASLRAQFTRPWSVIAGLRISNERVTDTNIDRPSIDEVYVDFEHENVITPYVGTLYTLDPTWSLYASYADIFAHNGGRLRSDLSLLPPMHGVTLEAGIKGAWRDEALNGSLAFYKNVQRNIAARVPEQSSVARCCYLPSEKLRAEGVDLELQGQLTRRSLIGGGYTFTRLRGRPIENLYAMPIPRHQLKVWTDYGLPGAWHRWTVGGSLHAQSTLAPVMQLAKQKSYAVLNPRVSYRFNERWQAALTVNNLFDKSYYEDIAKSAAYGEPRSYFLRLDARL